MDNPNPTSGSENRPQHWLRGLRPLLWWGLFVLVLYGIRQHQILSEQTQLRYAVSLQQRQVGYECSATLDGAATMSEKRVPIGWRKLTISHPKAELWTTNFFVWYGTNSLGEIALTRAKGTLAIQSAPPAALLRIRGPEYTLTLTNSAGTTIPVPTDRYTIEARYAHWGETGEVVVSPNMVNSWRFAPRIGDLQVTSSHPESSYRLLKADGQLVEAGELPSMVKDLPMGSYKLVVVRRGNQHETSVTVRAGITNNADVKLLYGTAALESDPTGATVLSTQGQSLGVTPVTLTELLPGRWEFVLRREGYEPAPVRLDIVANETNTFRSSLLSSRYVKAMNDAREYFRVANYDSALEAVGEALRVKAGDTDAAALQGEAKKQRELQQAKTVRERFDLLIRNTSEAITRGEVDNAIRQFTEVKKLFPDDPKIAELQKRMVPVFRDHTWRAANQTLIQDSPYSATGVWNYNMDLTAAREVVGKAISEALSFWKLKEEHKLNDQTLMMQLAARGLDQQRACILMLSEVGNAQVEIRYRICHYVTNDGKTGQIRLGPIAITSGVKADPATMRREVDGAVDDLLNSLNRHLEKNK